MEKLELKTEKIKGIGRLIQIIGAALSGFFTAGLFFALRFEGDLYWISSTTGLIFSLHLAFFPAIIRSYKLVLDETGIHIDEYFFQQVNNPVEWETLKELGRKGKTIKLVFADGNKDKIKLRFHTKEQLLQLDEYLKKAAEAKNLNYL